MSSVQTIAIINANYSRRYAALEEKYSVTKDEGERDDINSEMMMLGDMHSLALESVGDDEDSKGW